MKTLIFSDTHLSSSFDKEKYLFLKKIISAADRVIINGDFWEGQGVSFDKFINSSWKELFPLLKAKQAVYIYGNHDRKRLADERVGLFSVKQAREYRLKAGNKTLIIEHGDRLCPFEDESSHKNKPTKIDLVFYPFLERMAVKWFNARLHNLLFRHFNSIIKNKLAYILKENEVYVCGHTHSAEFNIQKGFINVGFIQHGLAQYLIVENESIIPKQEHYR